MSLLRIKILMLFALACGCAVATAQDGASVQELQQEASRYQQQLELLESDFGPLDRRLLEPLSGLARTFSAMGDAERAAQVMRRQLQLTRNTYGFEDTRLLSIIDSLVAIEVSRSEWQQVADYLELRTQLSLSLEEEASLSDEARAQALGIQSAWLLQQVALTPTRSAVNTFFAAREVDTRLAEKGEEVLSQHLDPGSAELVDPLESFRAWLPIVYRRVYSDYALVQLLNSRSAFAYDSLDYLTRRQGVGAMQKLSSPGFAMRIPSGPLSRVPMLEKGDPIGVGYLRDGYFQVRRMDIQLGDYLERLIADGAASDVIAQTREAQGMVRLVRGDFQVLQNRGSGMREYKQAREMLSAAGIAEEELNRFFARPRLIPSTSLSMTFAAALDDSKLDSGCLGEFTALSDRLATLEQPRLETESLRLALPMEDFLLRFGVSRRGKPTGITVEEASVEDSKRARVASRALSDLRFRPAIVDARSVRLRDQCLRLRVPTLEVD